MKRVLAMILVLLTVVSVSVLYTAADENGIKVNVTITDKQGNLALAMQEVTVTDIDGDSKLTINDALYAAHEQNYPGGADAGYATVTTEYGPAVTKLWGTADGFNYGYLVNDVSAWSLTDPVAEGDYVAAYNYTDSKNLMDRYSFFDKKSVTLTESSEVTLTLKKNDYDLEWTPLILAVAGAELTVDGQPTGVFTDENGQATLSLSEPGEYLVSAKATNQVIVPPVCLVTVPTTVSGSFTSWLDESAKVTIQLLQDDSVVYSTTVTGNTGTYSISGVADGSYTLHVSKKNHVSRDYPITVSGNTTLDVVIHPYGDINGDGQCTTVDYGMANSHARNKKLITDAYQFACGDVVAGAEKAITTVDAGRINSHVRNKLSLWK